MKATNTPLGWKCEVLRILGVQHSQLRYRHSSHMSDREEHLIIEVFDFGLKFIQEMILIIKRGLYFALVWCFAISFAS